jgi:hypothetical protein
MKKIGKQRGIASLTLLCLLGAGIAELEAGPGDERRKGPGRRHGFWGRHMSSRIADPTGTGSDGGANTEEENESNGEAGRRHAWGHAPDHIETRRAADGWRPLGPGIPAERRRHEVNWARGPMRESPRGIKEIERRLKNIEERVERTETTMRSLENDKAPMTPEYESIKPKGAPELPDDDES